MQLELMCGDQDRLLERITPRYLYSVTFFRVGLLKQYVKQEGDLLFVKDISTDLLKLILICQLTHQ